MKRTISMTALALAIAAALAVRIGGAVGAGVVAGVLCGASLAVGCALSQRKVVAARPARALHSSVLGFLVQLGALLCFTLALRYYEPALGRIDWRGFAVSFAAVVLLVMTAGALDNASVLRSLARTPAPKGEGALS